jgi:hypothetical protein
VLVSFFCWELQGPSDTSKTLGQAVVSGAQIDAPFELTWTIPSRLQPDQGFGGGATVPATCQFQLNPPFTGADFEVTPS